MTVHAYMFVETNIDPGDFVQKVRNVQGVVAAHALFGPLDALISIQAKDMEDLERIARDVHLTPGLKSGDTRIARGV
jgi:DNA-binding Lrp family transcriptional regulator